MIGEVQISRAPSNSISKSLFSFLNTIATLFVILSTIWSFVPTETQEPDKSALNNATSSLNLSPIVDSQKKISNKLDNLQISLNNTDKEKDETIENLKTKISNLEQKITKLEKLFLSST